MVFLELRRHSRLTTGISAFPLGWPWEAQSSPRVARESWGWPGPNFPLQGRQGSRGCIPGCPGESGLVSRGSQGLRSPLERGSLRTMHGGGSAPSCCAFPHRVAFEEGSGRGPSGLRWVWRNGRGPHLEGRQEPQAAPAERLLWPGRASPSASQLLAFSPGQEQAAGVPWWCSGKESTCQFRRYRRCSFDPWFGKIPWRRKWQPTPVFLVGKSHEDGPDAN